MQPARDAFQAFPVGSGVSDGGSPDASIVKTALKTWRFYLASFDANSKEVIESPENAELVRDRGGSVPCSTTAFLVTLISFMFCGKFIQGSLES